jgi:hypothetical protein
VNRNKETAAGNYGAPPVARTQEPFLTGRSAQWCDASIVE